MLDTILYLESDRMQNTELSFERLLRAKDMARKKRLLNVDNQIYGYINEEFLNLAFRSHPYMNPLIGWPDDIEAINLDELKKYFRKYFQPANATMVIVGDIDSACVVEMVKRHFGNIGSIHLPESIELLSRPKLANEDPIFREKRVWERF